jgi:hypothetical protein
LPLCSSYFRLEFPNCLAIIIINYTPAIRPSWRRGLAPSIAPVRRS